MRPAENAISRGGFTFYIKTDLLLLSGKDLNRSSAEFSCFGTARDPNVDLFASDGAACVRNQVGSAPLAGVDNDA